MKLEEMQNAYQNALKYSEDFTIKRWQEPFLWVLYFFSGYVITSENWKMYLVEFRGVKYLLKSEELEK